MVFVWRRTLLMIMWVGTECRKTTLNWRSWVSSSTKRMNWNRFYFIVLPCLASNAPGLKLTASTMICTSLHAQYANATRKMCFLCNDTHTGSIDRWCKFRPHFRCTAEDYNFSTEGICCWEYCNDFSLQVNVSSIYWLILWHVFVCINEIDTPRLVHLGTMALIM